MTDSRESSDLMRMARGGFEILAEQDPDLHEMLEHENRRQSETLAMVAASSIADPSVLACEGTATVNVTTEGYPGKRFHAGCSVVDQVERLAIERACQAFGAQYANVQPHSGSSANSVVLFSLLKPGDTILGLHLDHGGHLTHGSQASVSGQYFQAYGYGVNEDGFLDYDQALSMAREHRPKLIICGASSYPRKIDFARFREIADEVGAYLLADISHIAGLVVAGQHQNPVDHAHFTTTSTYKQLYGPRGGLVLIGRDVETLAPDGKKTLPDMISRAVFPYFQGTPNLSAIAAKARALAMVQTDEFKAVAKRVVDNAATLAEEFLARDYRVLTGGTDNHMVLVDILSQGITGVIAERSLEECNIIINKNKIAGDTKSAFVTSGMRLGTNSLALRGMGADEMRRCAELTHKVLTSVECESDKKYSLDPTVREAVREEVLELCRRFPIPNYPVPGPLTSTSTS